MKYQEIKALLGNFTPTTLAAIYNDIGDIVERDDEQSKISTAAYAVLTSIVGANDAMLMIDGELK